jgi:hypothetical protein
MTQTYEPDGPEPDATLVNASDTDGVPRPFDWTKLTSYEAEHTWLDLNTWVEEFRHRYCIDFTVVPPFWHRYSLLVELLTSLWLHYEGAVFPEQHASAYFGWLRDLEEWKGRMRQAVSLVGCRNDSVRPYKMLPWPGEPTPEPDPDFPLPPPLNLDNRYEDFVDWMIWDVARRCYWEDKHRAMLLAAVAQAGFPDEEDDNG